MVSPLHTITICPSLPFIFPAMNCHFPLHKLHLIVLLSYFVWIILWCKEINICQLDVNWMFWSINIYLCMSLLVCLSIHPSIYLTICLFICLSKCLRYEICAFYFHRIHVFISWIIDFFYFCISDLILSVNISLSLYTYLSIFLCQCFPSLTYFQYPIKCQ